MNSLYLLGLKSISYSFFFKKKKEDLSLLRSLKMAGVVHVIMGESDKGNGKNKRKAEDVLSVYQEPWAKQ